MKPLFLSLAIVGAVTLWYSNAHARDYRHSYQAPSVHHVSRHHEHFSHDRGRSGHHSGYASRHTNWNHGNDWKRSSNDWKHSTHADRYSHAGRDYSIDSRQQNQRERIIAASRSGELSRGERKALWGEQRAIAAEERAYRADGHLSRDERRDLQQDLTMASRHIYNETHDSKRAGSAWR